MLRRLFLIPVDWLANRIADRVLERLAREGDGRVHLPPLHVGQGFMGNLRIIRQYGWNHWALGWQRRDR